MNEERGMLMVHQTMGTVVCCKCGILIPPDAAKICANCLRSEFGITEGLKRHAIIFHCPECDRYLQPPKTWIKSQLESKELLDFCLKILKNLNKVKLIHAEYIWTEPHSKWTKVKVKFQKEVLQEAMEQAYFVDYVVQENICKYCCSLQANPDQWVASVQVRQHVPHRRTLFYLEQLILRYDAARSAKKIKPMDQGIDFFFDSLNDGKNFVEFISKVVPIRIGRHGQLLVSNDPKSNNYHYEYTLPVEICPICREDLICLPREVAASFGNMHPLVICAKLSSLITLLDPFTLKHRFLDAKQYWRCPVKALLSSRQLVEYVVLDVGIVYSQVNVSASKYALVEAEVARASDFGKNDTIFRTTTHLGHILNPGDHALGYDLHAANCIDVELEKNGGCELPKAILIKKRHEERPQRKVRNTASANKEYENFLRDLEENPNLRFNLSLHEEKKYQPSEMALEELLADLDLGDEEGK